MEQIKILNSKLVPNYLLEKGNIPLYITIYESGSDGSIEEIDSIDKSKNKAMFSGHFYVRKNGIIYKGREINEIGEFSTLNTNNIGVCIEGKFDTDFLGEIQLNSINKLVRFLKENYSIVKLMYLTELDNNIMEEPSPGALFPYIEPIRAFYNKKLEKYDTHVKNMIYYRYGFREFNYTNPCMQGNDIFYLQGLLREIGYDIECNGIYDKFTYNIIEAIKKENGYVSLPDVNFGSSEYKLINKLYIDKMNENGFFRIMELRNDNTMKGKDILSLQSKLNTIGFVCDTNSYYDDNTRKAVEALQSSEIIHIDGRVGPITYNSILKRMQTTFKRDLYFTSPNFFGDDVKLLQEKLNSLGFICSVNSKYDRETENAVKGFQFNKDLEVNGFVDIFLWKKIFGY